MKQHRLFKQTTFLTVFIYLSLSGYMSIGMEHHAMQHGRSPHSAAQHASFFCTWMCAATTYVHSADQVAVQPFFQVFDALTFYTEKVFLNKPLLALYIRPPPFIPL